MATSVPNDDKARPQRADNLLPAASTEDGRFDVAEEVNLDQQSDAARHRAGARPACTGRARSPAQE